MNASDLLALPAVQAANVELERQRMDEAHCVFDFTVRRLADRATPEVAKHRALLTLMFDEVEAQGLVRWAQYMALHPAYTTPPTWKLKRGVAAAWPTPWNASGLADAMRRQPGDRRTMDQASSMRDTDRLFPAFDTPASSADCPPGLFADFCEAVGLSTAPDVHVFDWVGDMDDEPERST